jgi:hypothetical protein
LLVFEHHDQAVSAWRETAQRMGLSLQVVQPEVHGLHEIYQAPMVLIRPDQIVAWRGDADSEPTPVWRQLLGLGT